MNHGRARQQQHPRLEDRRHGERMVQRKDAEAERDGNVRVADLRGIDDFRLFAPAVIKRQQRVRQHHQPAAQPAEMFRADEAGVDVRNPADQPVRADVNRIRAGRQQREVHGQHPVDGRFSLPHVRLEHFKDVEALPEQKQPDQNQAVVEIQPAFAPHRPDRAGEKQNRRQREQQREPVQFRRLACARLFLFAARIGFLFRQDVHAPDDGGQAEDQRHVGDVVDERVGHHVRAVAAVAAEDEGEDQGCPCRSNTA